MSGYARNGAMVRERDVMAEDRSGLAITAMLVLIVAGHLRS